MRLKIELIIERIFFIVVLFSLSPKQILSPRPIKEILFYPFG